MAGGKETPRQKMIGMMYLVLTALLALNVSKEIINAFVTLNDKIEAGNRIIQGSSEEIIGYFDNANTTVNSMKESSEEEKERAQFQLNVANDIHARTRVLSNFFIMNASEMIKASEGTDWYEGNPENEFVSLINMMEINAKDNYDIATGMFIEGTIKGLASGDEIVDSIRVFRDYLIGKVANYKNEEPKEGQPEVWEYTPPAEDWQPNLLPDDAEMLEEQMEESFKNCNPEDKRKLKQIFKLLTLPANVMNHEEEVPWIAGQFDHAPIVAAAAIFTSLRGDALQAEAIALDLLKSKSKVPTFDFDTIDALAFAPSSYINAGDSLDITVKIAAYKKNDELPVYYWIDDSTAWKEYVASGRATKPEGAMEATSIAGIKLTGSNGKHLVQGVLIAKEKGRDVAKPWEYTFEVGSPSAAVSNRELNVLYRNYDNKITASGSGFPKINVSCQGCTITQSGDEYIARVGNQAREATIVVQGVADDGSTAEIGRQKFRVMSLPTPTAYLSGGQPTDGMMARSRIATSTVLAKLLGAPIDKPFSVNGGYVVVEVQGITKKYPLTGNKIPGDAQRVIKSLKPGAMVTIQPKVVSGGAVIPTPPRAYQVQ